MSVIIHRGGHFLDSYYARLAFIPAVRRCAFGRYVGHGGGGARDESAAKPPRAVE